MRLSGLNGPAPGLALRLVAFLAAGAAFWSAISLPPVFTADGPADAARPAPAQAAPAGGTPDDLRGESDQASRIAAHPLFYPSRKPWTPPPPPEPPKGEEKPPAPPLSGYKLVGVVISGTSQSALIKEPSGEKTLVLQAGQTLDGWELKRVTKDKVHFESGGQAYELAFPRPAERNG